MKKTRKTGFRVTVPKVFLKEFIKEPRFVLDPGTAGLWPVPLKLLKDSKFINRLIRDRTFVRDFEIMIIPKR